MVLNEQYLGICFGSSVWGHNLYCSGNRGVSCSSVFDCLRSGRNSTIDEKRIDWNATRGGIGNGLFELSQVPIRLC